MKTQQLHFARKQASSETRDRAVTSLLDSHLIAEAGVLTTNITSGEQWDAPNAWPPLVQMTIEGLQRANTPSSNEAAVRVSVAQDGYKTCFG